MDTLQHVRRLARFIKSQERKALRRKMDGYNSLARQARSSAPDKEALDTIHDVSQYLTHNMSQHVYERDSRIRKQEITNADKLAANVVSDEVREAWHARIGMSNVLSAATREQLRRMPTGLPSKSQLREQTLSALAAYMVTMWCDVEGYDPDKHVKRGDTK